jgi:hypothetical protein
MQNPGPGYTTPDGSVVNCLADPNGSGHGVLEMKVTAQTCTYHCERREDWDSPHFITPGWNGYISIPIMIPRGGVPQSLGPSPGYGAMFNEQFGMPTAGSPSNSLSVQNALNYASGGQPVFAFSGNTTGTPGGGTQLWRDNTPAADGHWHDFIEHFVASTNKSVGEIELWKDGRPITFPCHNTATLSGCGTTTLHYATLIPGATNSGNNWVQINNYRNYGSGTYTTTFVHGAPAAGLTYSSVAATVMNAPYGP